MSVPVNRKFQRIFFFYCDTFALIASRRWFMSVSSPPERRQTLFILASIKKEKTCGRHIWKRSEKGTWAGCDARRRSWKIFSSVAKDEKRQGSGRGRRRNLDSCASWHFRPWFCSFFVVLMSVFIPVVMLLIFYLLSCLRKALGSPFGCCKVRHK